jgi:vitamin B12 transporter
LTLAATAQPAPYVSDRNVCRYTEGLALLLSLENILMHRFSLFCNLLTLPLLCLSGVAVTAQTTKVTASTQTIDVNAEPIPFDTLAGSYDSITRDQLMESGARDVSEVLRFAADVHFSQSGGKGSLSTISIRGGKPNFTLVLIDGFPANDIGDQLGGAFNFATLDTDDIERIDIYRGPLSTLYGSEAIGGVINIVLRKPENEPAVHGAVEGGEFGYVRALGGVAGKLGGVDMSADGSLSRIGEQVFKDGSTLGTAAVAADKKFTQSTSLNAFTRWNRLSDSNLPVGSGGPVYALSKLAEINLADQISGGVDFHQQVNRHWLYSAEGGLFSRVASDNSPAIYDSIPPGAAYVPASVSHTRFLRSEGRTTQQITPRPWFDAYSTVFIRQESGTTVGTLGGYLPGSYKLDRTTFNFSEDANLHNKRGALSGGFSVEKSTAYGTVVSPRAGGTFLLANYQFHASWGKGFKLPSFYSLGNPLIGNKALSPETSRGIDVGVSRDFSETHTHFAVSYFDTSYHNLIDFSPSIFKLVNRNAAFSRGSDFELNQTLHRLTLGTTVTYVDAGLSQTTERLGDVPRWSEELHAHLVLPHDWTAQAATVWVGRRFDYQVPVPQIAIVPKYSMTNVEITHRFAKFGKEMNSYVRLENVFNNKFQEFVGFPSAGIYASAGVSFKLDRATPAN